MLTRCLAAALFLLLAIPARAEDGQCQTIADVIEQAVEERPDTEILEQFTGARATQLVRTIRQEVTGGEVAIAEQIIALGAPDEPDRILAGFHGGCWSFRLGLPEETYRALIELTFGKPA